MDPILADALKAFFDVIKGIEPRTVVNGLFATSDEGRRDIVCLSRDGCDRTNTLIDITRELRENNVWVKKYYVYRETEGEGGKKIEP